MAEEEALKAYRIAFGKNLRKIRKERISTLSGVDTNTKFNASNYHKYELGNGNPTLETILLIATGLGVHPKDLLNFDFDFKKIVNR
jgi:transcriptional regulator with XRE-family HTH domain